MWWSIISPTMSHKVDLPFGEGCELLPMTFASRSISASAMYTNATPTPNQPRQDDIYLSFWLDGQVLIRRFTNVWFCGIITLGYGFIKFWVRSMFCQSLHIKITSFVMITRWNTKYSAYFIIIYTYSFYSALVMMIYAHVRLCGIYEAW